MPRRGRHRKKTRTHVVDTDERITSALHSNDSTRVPRSLVVRRGKTEGEIMELVGDMRNLMRPYTALNFREDARNRKMTLTHYASALSGPLGITHVLALSQNSGRITLRIGRAPAGPTLTFRVKRFTLARHVRKVQRHSYDNVKIYDSPPIIVTNNFGDVSAPPHVKLMRITFQNMFPAINVSTVKLADCRRVVLFNLIRRNVDDAVVCSAASTDGVDDDGGGGGGGGRMADGGDGVNDDDLEDEEVEVRHYAIRTKPVGIDRRVRRLVESRVPNLGKLNDIADYITGSNTNEGGGLAMMGDVSDSEAEDESNHVVMPPSTRGGGRRGGGETKDGDTARDGSSTKAVGGGGNKSALKLVEIGPRLRLKLHKVERLLSSGDVMYHAYVTKTPAEIASLKKRKEDEVLLKKRRREEQEMNVERKRRAKEEKREARENRRKERENRAMAALRGEGGTVEDDGGSGDENYDDEDEDDDVEEDQGSDSDDGADEDDIDENGDDDEDGDASGSEEEDGSEGTSR
ncbi:hypothetical protein ACHAXA_000551 [Cyclostephanos tholiformis]|uniref:Brix domain-containing protein n=1 Tax=Cyclostephanos tholiformis TaxID=382380 RepID=A0ABD3ST90_9STRA